MSKVYSFRLDDNNHREAQAREVIVAWVKEGYSLRQVLVEALLILKINNSMNEDLQVILEEIRVLLHQTGKKMIQQDDKRISLSLEKSFISSVANVVKPGLHSDY